MPPQKAVKDILKSGSAISVHPVLETIRRVNEKRGVNLIEGENLDEVFQNLSRKILKTELVKEFRFERIGLERYVLHVDGCVWACHIHEELKPKDVTCPYALVAMSIFEGVANKRVKVTDSEYTETGTKTKIEPL